MQQTVKTVDRALRILLAVANSDEPLRMSELGKLTTFDRTTTYRLMQPLLEHALVAREADGRRYVVGPGLVAVSAAVIGKMTVRTRARPLLERISRLTPETVSLHVRDRDERVCVEVVDGSLPVRRVVPVGERLPLYAGTTGKAMLAFLSEEDRNRITAAGGGSRAIARIKAQLGGIRERRYIAEIGDRIPDVAGLSIPVFDSTGVVASITVSGPGDRFSHETMATLAPDLVLECESLSADLGYVRGET